MKLVRLRDPATRRRFGLSLDRQPASGRPASSSSASDTRLRVAGSDRTSAERTHRVCRRPAKRTSASCRASSRQRARLGTRRAAPPPSTGRSTSRCLLRQRDDHRRPHPPFLAAERPRCDQRHDPVRRSRHPPRRCDGDARRRAGAVRRAHRLRRLRAGRVERDRARQDMHLRYPEGIRSVVDADLAVTRQLRDRRHSAAS